MLEKEVCKKQDALVALRQQLDDLRALKHELTFKLQSSDLGVKQKSELNSHLEEKTNQMAATIKQLKQGFFLVIHAGMLNSPTNIVHVSLSPASFHFCHYILKLYLSKQKYGIVISSW
uniref:Uncharacterized protein n=1 Tax=Prolemur simus TaxID=1328070 RepID=A0A8C8YNM1_PROSS